MKIFHNDKVSLGWAVAIELVVHALFAFQAFALGDFLGEIALVVVLGPIGGPIGAWALGIFIFGAAFQAFVLGEYMREHVEAFETTAKGNGSYIANWKLIKWLVGGIEISSLLFRCALIITKDGNWMQAVIVAILGIIALWYAFAQAKVIHASVNRPVEYDVNRARNEAGRAIVSEALDVIPHMTAEQKRRFYTGDLSAVEEVYQSGLQQQQQKLQVKEDKEEQKRQRKLEAEQRREAKRIEQEERKERERNRRRQQEQEQQQAIATGQKYTEQLLGGPNTSAPFLRAVPMSKQERDGA